jgi:hypothetical protein
MGYSTKGGGRESDRILDSIDRARSRNEFSASPFDRQASGRDLNTEVPGLDAMQSERIRRVFKTVETAYVACAQSPEIRKLAARFQSIGDLNEHQARGDVSVTIQYLDHDRYDDIGMAPFEISAEDLDEEKKTSGTNRADANGLRILRTRLRDGVQSAFAKLEPRVRDAVRERADIGHVAAVVTVDLRSVS